MKKFFTIHANDAGSEAYDTSYVLGLEAEIGRLQETANHFEKFISFAATCQRENTYDWMRLMLDWLNGAAMRFDEANYFELKGAHYFLVRRCDRTPAE